MKCSATRSPPRSRPMEQARERTDKGVEAAEAAIEMANLRRSLGKA